jgi:hypothetical protein
LPGLQGFPLKSGWKPLWPHYICVLHACKTTIMWTMPRFATRWSSSRAPLEHGCGDL